MDLCGETFSCQPRTEETQDALMSMDSDCVPDPCQYNLPESKSKESSSHDTQSAYCNEFCGYVLPPRTPSSRDTQHACRMPFLRKYFLQPW